MQTVPIKHNYLNIFVNTYVCISPKSMVFIDGGLKSSINLYRDIFSIIEKQRQLYAINTHGHWDHIGLCEHFRSLGARLFAHPGDEQFYRDFDWHYHYMFEQYRKDVEIPAARRTVFEQSVNMPIFVDQWLKDKDSINLRDNEAFDILHTPGHSIGSVCIFAKNEGSLFTGDTMLGNGFYDWLPQFVDGKKLIQSMQKLRLLDVKTIYSAHHPEPIDGKQIKIMADDCIQTVEMMFELVENYILKQEHHSLHDIVTHVCNGLKRSIGAGACVSTVSICKELASKYPSLREISERYIV